MSEVVHGARGRAEAARAGLIARARIGRHTSERFQPRRRSWPEFDAPKPADPGRRLAAAPVLPARRARSPPRGLRFASRRRHSGGRAPAQGRAARTMAGEPWSRPVTPVRRGAPAEHSAAAACALEHRGPSRAHHATYVRVGFERLEDRVWLCDLHDGRPTRNPTSTEPALFAPVRARPS